MEMFEIISMSNKCFLEVPLCKKVCEPQSIDCESKKAPKRRKESSGRQSKSQACMLTPLSDSAWHVCGGLSLPRSDEGSMQAHDNHCKQVKHSHT